tara:strand:+ start:1570 stop:2199 length:630 start_codon:yes stop_codon:yes gene_type:complete
MANSNEMFDDLLTKKESFFIPEAKEKKEYKAPNVRGEFYGHIKNATQKQVEWNKDGEKFKAIVYNYDFEVAKENESQKYTYEHYKDGSEQTSMGKDYIGRIYKGSGVFRFLEPEDGDDFISNASGNRNYQRFCETLQVEIPTKTVEMNGESVDVQALPCLDSSEINGRPVIAVIDKGKPYTWKGKQVTPHVVKFVKKWEGGEVSNDIPF